MRSFEESLVGAHAGRAAVICGGAPSLPSDLAACPVDAVYLSANQHGCLIRQCDYIVSMDKIHNETWMDKRTGRQYMLRDFNTPIIAPYDWADYKLLKRPPLVESGIVASWLAHKMGCSPVIITGVSLYQGATYFHDMEAKSHGQTLTLAEHYKHWDALLEQAPNGVFRAVSGPLLNLFPQYDPLARTRTRASDEAFV